MKRRAYHPSWFVSRLMAVRCGTYSIAPSIADLAPGAKPLYTNDGQAVTIVAAHADSGEPFFIVGVVNGAAVFRRSVGGDRGQFTRRTHQIDHLGHL